LRVDGLYYTLVKKMSIVCAEFKLISHGILFFSYNKIILVDFIENINNIYIYK
jgi:hypothetical protein